MTAVTVTDTSNHKEKQMGTFKTECVLENHQDRTRSLRVPDVMVDTGSELTWIRQEYLKSIGVEPEKRKQVFYLANGQKITRSFGYAIVHAGGESTIDEVVFARESDQQLLGARTLEGLSLVVDPCNKQLIAGGPKPVPANYRIR